MAYSGPTFVPRDEYVAYQQQQFDELAKLTPLPSEPYRVEVESQKFDDLVKDTRPPGDEISVRLEQERFDQLLAEQPPLDLAHVGEESAAAPEAVSMPPSSGDDPVSRTLAFLGIGKPSEALPEDVDRQGPDQPPLQPVGMLNLPGGPGVALPFSPVVPKPVPPSEEEQQRVIGGEPFTPEDATGELMKWAAQQGGQMQPAAAAGLPMVPGTFGDEAAEALAKRLTSEGMGAGAESAGKALAAGDGLVGPSGLPLRPPKGETNPILGASGEVLKEVKVKATKPVPPEVVAEVENWVPEKVSLFRKVFDRSRNIIAGQGEAGKELAERVHRWREGAERTAADWVERMPTVRKLSKNEMVNLVDVLERGRVEKAAGATPMNARVAQAAVEAKEVLDEVYTLAQNAGVGVAEKIENYFPHVFKQDIVTRLKDDKQRRAILDHLIGSGQAEDEAAAGEIMQRYVQAGRDRRHGGLEQERLANLPGYEKTKEALYRHLMTTSRRIHEVAQFGAKDEIANRLIDRVKTSGKDADTVRHMWQTIVHATPQDEGLASLSSGIRAFNTITRLGWASVGNATQGANTASVVGVYRTMQAAKKAAWSAEDKAFADRTGVTLDSVIREVREGGGWSDRVPGVLQEGVEKAEEKLRGVNPLMPFFNQVEVFNRRLTAIAGRDYAIDMAAKGNAKELRKLGLDPEAVAARKGKLTEDEQITAARSIVERTQFKVDVQDMPAWTSHPLGRLVMQFRTFGYSQTAFVARELVKPALEGDVRPLVRFALTAIPANAAATELRNAIHGREAEEDPGARAAQYVLGTTGEVGNLARGAFGVNSKYLPPDRRTAMLLSSLLGPTAGLASDVAVSGMNAADYVLSGGERGGFTPALRTGLRQIPLVGTRLQNTFAPYKEKKPERSSAYVLPSRSERSNTRDGRR
jgi:hypothetical protein